MKGIIIFGIMGSGKDTLAAMILDKINNSKIYKLGEEIRSMVDANNPGGDNRKLYQEYGQKRREVEGIDVWNNSCKRKIEMDSRVEKFKFPVIADGRQLNEAAYWKELGFYVVGITAPSQTRYDRLIERDGSCDITRMTHDTELQAQYVSTQIADYMVENDCSLEYLDYIAEEIAEIVKVGD